MMEPPYGSNKEEYLLPQAEDGEEEEEEKGSSAPLVRFEEDAQTEGETPENGSNARKRKRTDEERVSGHPKKGILKKLRAELSTDATSPALQEVGEPLAPMSPGTESSEPADKTNAASEDKPPSPELTFMNDAEALAFLTSPSVLEAWPFMADLHFLVTVITDMRVPDYPVIYASDSFEGLTLYEKKDILGSNCRILQGKCTNKQTVDMLNAAIKRGEQVEAHLLNYRKDGTPFWNKFMALPIMDREGSVTHYVGIQQDVTLLTEMGSDPRKWTSPEVGMWLDHVDLGDYSLKAIQNDIVGADLFSKDPNSFADKLGMTNEQDREYLQRKMKRLKRNPQLSFSSSFSSFDFSHSAISLQALSRVGPKKVRFDLKTFFPPDVHDKVTVRCLHRERMHLFSIHKDTSFSRLRNKIRSIVPRLSNCVVQQLYEEPDCLGGSATAIQIRPTSVDTRHMRIFTIQNDEDLAQAIARVISGRSQSLSGKPVMRLRLVSPDEADRPQSSLLSDMSLGCSSPFASSSLSLDSATLTDPSLSLLCNSSFFSASLPVASLVHATPCYPLLPARAPPQPVDATDQPPAAAASSSGE